MQILGAREGHKRKPTRNTNTHTHRFRWMNAIEVFQQKL